MFCMKGDNTDLSDDVGGGAQVSRGDGAQVEGHSIWWMHINDITDEHARPFLTMTDMYVLLKMKEHLLNAIRR